MAGPDPSKVEFTFRLHGDSDWLEPHENEFLRNVTQEEQANVQRVMKRAIVAECKRLVALRAPPRPIDAVPALRAAHGFVWGLIAGLVTGMAVLGMALKAAGW